MMRCLSLIGIDALCLGCLLMKSIASFIRYTDYLKSLEIFKHLVCIYDFSTLYTTLPHNLIKEKLTKLIEQIFNREGSLYLACNDENALFTGRDRKCVMISIVFWTIYLYIYIKII